MKIIFIGDSLTAGNPGVSFLKILESKYNKHELINYGRGGDTVISLYQRIKENKLDLAADLSFLWIGTNDVLAKVAGPVKNILNLPFAKDPSQFEDYYKLTIDLLSAHCEKLITIAPIFIGEDFGNRWNTELNELEKVIEDISANYANVEYLDLRRMFVKEMQAKTPSEYILKSPVRLMIDSGLASLEEINKKSTERELFYTLDGIHFNGRGADLVAKAIFKVINAKTIMVSK